MCELDESNEMNQCRSLEDWMWNESMSMKLERRQVVELNALLNGTLDGRTELERETDLGLE